MHYSEDRLFRCDRCPFRTPLKHHMTSHRMNHDDDKPFSCELCSYRAVSQSMVNSHKKSHSTVRPYVCDYPRCHYATKFVNQLTKHREKQHPGFVSSPDGSGRRRRPSVSVPPSAGQARHLSYPDDRISGLPPTVLPQAASATGPPPPMPDDVTAHNAAAAMLPWSMPPWSPFNFLQRMAAAAAVSGLPLCAPSAMSLSAQRPVDMKPFQLPSSTLPCSQTSELVPGERGSTSTPRKPASAVFDGRRDAVPGGLSMSPMGRAATRDMDSQKSFLAHLSAAATGTNSRMNVAGDVVTTGAPAVPQALATNSSALSREPRTLMPASPCLRSNIDAVVNSQQVQSGRDLSLPGPTEHNPADDHPLDLTAKTSVTASFTEHPPDVYQPADSDSVETSNHDRPTVRKPSRRKGVAHKLDTACVNEWTASDVTNETFDLVPPSTLLRTAAGSLERRRSSSPRAPSPDRSGSSSCPQHVDKATLNDVRTGNEGNGGDAAEKEHISTSAGLHRRLKTAEIGGGSRGDADEDDVVDGDVSACRRLNVPDAGPPTTPSSQECRYCHFVFKHPAMFDIHMGFHKFDEPWRCNRCGHRCTDCVDFNRHIAAASHLGQV